MFANTPMLGVEDWPKAGARQLMTIRSLIEQRLAQRKLSPEEGEILREVHRVLEAMHAHMVNQDSVIRALQARLMDSTRR